MVCQMGAGLTYVFSALQKDVITELEWTRTMFSSARAPVFLVVALASPLAGSIAARWGARPVLLASTFLLALAYAVVSQMTELWHFYLANVLIGMVVAGLGDVVVGSVIAQWLVGLRGMALGIVYSGSNLAGFLGLPVVAWVSTQYGWRTAVVVIVTLAVALITPFAALAVREPKPGEVPAVADRGAGPAASESIDLGEALRTRSFWILAFLLFAFFFYFVAMIDHTVAYLMDLGYSKVEAASSFAFAIGLGVWSKLGAGAVADRMSSRSALACDFALLTLSSVLAAFVDRSGVLSVFLVSYGVSVAARDVVYPMIVADCFGVRYMARIYGALMVALLPGGALGPIVAASFHDRYQTYRPAFALFVTVNLLAFASIFFLRDERDHRRRAAG